MMFKPGTKLYSYETVRESGENVMYVNYLGAAIVPNLINSAEVMARTLDLLKEDSAISRVVFVQQRNYSHDFSQVRMLMGVADLYETLVKQENLVSIEKLQSLGIVMQEAYALLNYILNEVLKADPVKAYRELRGVYYEQKAVEEQGGGNGAYVNLIESILLKFEELELIKKLSQYFDNYSIGDRQIYSEVFRADVMPNFTFTRMVAKIPDDAEIIRQYEIGEHEKSLVTILKQRNRAKMTYHLSPPEYNLNEDHHMLLNLARNVLIEHQPRQEEFRC